MKNEKQIKLIEDDISAANSILSKNKSYEEIEEFLCDLEDKYRDYNIHVSSNYIIDLDTGKTIYEGYPKELKCFINKLRVLVAKLQDEDNNAATNHSNLVNIHNDNTNTANANITQNISIKSTMEKIDQIPDEILAENLKDELKGLLSELENCKDNQEKKSKLMGVVKWLGDKTADAFIACLPYFAGLSL
ncbi:hypothetical protein [uncultured Campylobacter sp.]|uniref:hypothetical protein n=1 Tax=uncultured Campylobacter sp. TaxID=218934 RepID=UPI002627E9DB|nr:hypothetical protein [uncultured Campylobacter sp.]